MKWNSVHAPPLPVQQQDLHQAPSKKLTPEQKEDIKNIKLDEISAKWICPFKGKKKPVGGDGGQNGDSGEGWETSVGENVETEDECGSAATYRQLLKFKKVEEILYLANRIFQKEPQVTKVS